MAFDDADHSGLSISPEAGPTLRLSPDAQTLLDAIGSPAMLIDGNQKIQVVNRAMEHKTGRDRAQLLGQRCSQIIHCSQERHPDCPLRRVIQTGSSAECDTYQEQDGRWTRSTIHPSDLRGPDGQEIYLHIARDITERKRAEEQKRELEEQLRQSQKIDAIGRLAGGVAHDFNNLLTVIKSCLMFIRESMNSMDPVLEDVSEAEKATERAVALTRQLLAFSRQQVAKPEVVDLNEVVTNLEKMLRRLVGEDIRIIPRLEPELRKAKIDVGHLEQVLVNLAVNARDAMPTGGLLRIRTENLDIDQDYASHHLGMRPGPVVVITVRDSGQGMEPDVLDRVFEPFFTTKAKGEGTGLGLSTAYGIVKQADGYILATSEPGRGSEFKIFLPVHQGEAPTHSETQAASEKQCQSTRIVLVEDDPAVKRAAARILSEQGHEVLQAASGQAAISMLEADPEGVELVVTDVVMPDMSGKELADWMDAHRPGLPLVYMSGYTDEVIARHGVLEEGVWLLEKPFSKGAMLKIIREILADARHRKTERSQDPSAGSAPGAPQDRQGEQ